jgi:Xaa-Pro aminopeptidase
MRPKFEAWTFFSKEQRETAACLFDFWDHVSHGVGMCVHDVSLHHNRPFEPGMVFAVDPMAWDRKNQTYYRVEDTVVITENGCEVLTKSCPLKVEDIEALMRGSQNS